MNSACGIGVDIEDIGRFARKPFTTNQSFYQKIFTRQEINDCLAKKNAYPSFAVRFCAKEALVKALGKNDIPYQQIEVIKVDHQPFVVWRGKRYTVSLSHDRDKAIAVVII